MSTKISGIRSLVFDTKIFTQKFVLPERFKGTIIEKWANYWKNLAFDYKEVGVDLIADIRQKPLKASIYGSVFSTIYFCVKNNPDEEDFITKLIDANTEIVLVHESCQNPKSSEHLKFVERCYNEGIVRKLSLGVLTIMWLDNYDKAVGIYKASCPYLKPSILTFNERIIDVGFWKRWWTLENKMKDYDINVQ